MIKILSYVSKINKSQKEMNKLFQTLMKNLKISYAEEESTIKFDDYYFNGIPSPKDIEFKDVGLNSFNVFWKIDRINLLNLEEKELKYKIKLRKENTNDKYIQIDAGNNMNYLINNLEKNTNYEIEICSIYKDIISDWTKLKIKTSAIDSLIINESERREEFIKKLYEWSGYNKMELIYRGTRDGSGSNTFHNTCDNQGPTICLCKNGKNNIFGGFSPISWTTNTGFYDANTSFLFTLTNIHNSEPLKFPNIKSSSIGHYSGYCARFGQEDDLYLVSDYLNNNKSYSKLGNYYQDILGKGNSVFTGDPNNNIINFRLKEMEVFKLFN